MINHIDSVNGYGNVFNNSSNVTVDPKVLNSC